MTVPLTLAAQLYRGSECCPSPTQRAQCHVLGGAANTATPRTHGAMAQAEPKQEMMAQAEPKQANPDLQQVVSVGLALGT